MARNTTHIDATPERVFEVLADPRSYGHWVVGSSEIRAADPDWPRPGSAFHHSVGCGPLTIEDETTVEACDPPRMLKLRAKARPLGTARVTLELDRAVGWTNVTMVEDPADWLTAFVFNPLTHLVVRGRNAGSLARLKALAEGRDEMPTGEELADASASEEGSGGQRRQAGIRRSLAVPRRRARSG